jgi:hypothetical protein
MPCVIAHGELCSNWPFSPEKRTFIVFSFNPDHLLANNPFDSLHSSAIE